MDIKDTFKEEENRYKTVNKLVGTVLALSKNLIIISENIFYTNHFS